MINSLGQLNAVEVGQNAVRVAHKMLVNKVHKLVLGAVLHLIVVLGLAEGGELLGSLELIKVDIDLSGHALTSHCLTTIAKEVEILNATDNLEVVHNTLTDQICLLRISKNGNGLV